jgi:hypothetical protein
MFRKACTEQDHLRLKAQWAREQVQERQMRLHDEAPADSELPEVPPTQRWEISMGYTETHCVDLHMFSKHNDADFVVALKITGYRWVNLMSDLYNPDRKWTAEKTVEVVGKFRRSQIRWMKKVNDASLVEQAGDPEAARDVPVL